MVTKLDKHNFKVIQALAPNTYNADTVSAAIDTQGVEAITFVTNMGTFGDADTVASANKIDFQVQHSDDTVSGNFVDVLASDLSDTVSAGSETGVYARIDDATDASKVYASGYIGAKRYVRINVDFTGTHSTGSKFAVSVVKSEPHNAPLI